MHEIAEHFFLNELTYLCAAALSHAEVLESSAKVWLKADEHMKRLLARSGHWSYEESRTYSRHTNEKISAQNEIFRRIESFVAVHGRIIDILRPTGSKKDRVAAGRRMDRATHLRKVLKVRAGLALLNKDLRNAWTHFDEILDVSCVPDPEKVNPQRVCKRASAAVDTCTLRLIIVDELRIRIFGQGECDLHTLFRELRDLAAAVENAENTWVSRWATP